MKVLKREKEKREKLEKNRDCLGIFGRGDVEGPMKGEKHKYLFSKVKASEPSVVDMLQNATDTGAATGADTSADTPPVDVNMLQDFAELFGTD